MQLFIAGDWGSTHLRLYLCDEHGTLLDQRQGPGAAHVAGALADVFDSLSADWGQLHGPLPAVLCGMVGSNIGWTTAPYLACPAQTSSIADACVVLRDGRVHIIPGLSCRNPFDAPDFMRGEETQILGALQLESSLQRGAQLLCLPGTHTKWVWLQDGAVRQFLTAPSGELFSVLCAHSVLVRSQDNAADIDMQAFKAGLAQLKMFPSGSLLHRLFECRSRQLSGDLTPKAAAAHLSALLIGSDVEGALRAFSGAAANSTVYLVGSPTLTKLYATSLNSYDFTAVQLDGATTSLAGLTQVHRSVMQDV
jgi:2-dehydro-3-deoxygalactonokinase